MLQGSTAVAMGSFKGLKTVRSVVEDCMRNVHREKAMVSEAKLGAHCTRAAHSGSSRERRRRRRRWRSERGNAARRWQGLDGQVKNASKDKRRKKIVFSHS